MDNCLVLLTNYFPFHKGEEYLESEINFLSKEYNQIYIISTMVSKEMKQTRATPKNVITIPIGIKHSTFGKIKMVLRKIIAINRDLSKRKIIKQDSSSGFLRKMYCYYFESRAMEIYDQLVKVLNKYNFSEYKSITIYSYWLYITARVAIELKTNYFKNQKPYTISRAHRYDLYEYATPLKYLPERVFLLENLDAIYPCSQDGVDFLTNKYPDFTEKINVERLGTVFLDNNKAERQREKTEKLFIVSCSVMRKVKRLDLLIQVLRKLEEHDIPYFWTHIGGGPEFNKIKRLSERKLSTGNFRLTGSMSNTEVLNWFSENPSTVFVNLSSSEGVPVAIMEASSMGIPVIATDVGGTREIIEDGVNGYLLDPKSSVLQIVDCLINFYKIDDNEYNNMSRNSFEIWNNRSNAEIIYCKFANLLKTKSESNMNLQI